MNVVTGLFVLPEVLGTVLHLHFRSGTLASHEASKVIITTQWAEKGVHAILGSQEALLVNLGPS